MAKKQSGLDDLFKRTERGIEFDVSDLDAGNIKSTGVGLREGELAALDAIQEAHGLESRNQIMRFAVRWFLVQYRAGNVDLGEYIEQPPPPRKTLRLPGAGE